VLYGPGFVQDQGDLSVGWDPTLADLAPTLAELLQIDFPRDRPGRSISAALLPERQAPPRLIVNIVWDGGGWNVLDQWPKEWPTLARLMNEGTSVRGVTVGSSPSVTPAIHATMGTGEFPDRHGIVDIPMRDEGKIVDSYEGNDPRYLEVDTLADIYRSEGGRKARIAMMAEDGWHLGMMGHGAYLPHGSKDIAILTDRTADEFVTNTRFFSLPEYVAEVSGFEDDVREVDLDDGRLDGRWLNRPLTDPKGLYSTPVWLLYQNRVLKALIENEHLGSDDTADLLFVNYKQIDHVGHKWNMISPEEREVVRYTDAALEDLLTYLDAAVGRNRWVVSITADHGQMPLLESIGALPIDIDTLTSDLEAHFGFEPRTFIQEERPVGMWLDTEVGSEAGVTTEEAAAFLYDYRARNNLDLDSLPEQYRSRGGERLFRAVFPGDRLKEIWDCAVDR
jgi:arylsulfatase A-like enzyme